MTKRKWLFVIPLVLLLVALPLLGACAPKAAPPTPALTPAAPPKPKLPEVFRMCVLPLGSLGYAISLPLGEALKAKTGIALRVIPGGSEVARVLPVRAGEAEFTFLHSGNAIWIANGIEDYAVEEWGPQPLRYVWAGSTGANTWVTRGDAGLRKVEDLKGKRILIVPGNVFFTRGQLGPLMFGGLSWEDVKLVSVPSSGAGFKAILEGTGDSMLLSTAGTGSYELQASKHGVYFIGFPFANKEGWLKLQSECPYIYPYICAVGAGLSKANAFEASGSFYFLGAYRQLPEDYAYTMTKGIWEGFDVYKDKHPNLIDWTHERCLAWQGLLHPYHDGTVKYFKEIKVWTPEMEAWQTKMVKQENDRLALWPEAQKMAADKKIALGSPAFKEFWEKLIKERKLFTMPEALLFEDADGKFTVKPR